MTSVFMLTIIVHLALVIGAVAFRPPVVPLAVRSPYFSSWLRTRDDDTVPNAWPKFWSMNHTLGLAGLARIDGKPYTWMGAVRTSISKPADVKDIQVTPTRTIFVLEAGNVQLNVTYLSPIEPNDLTLQSFPFSYIYVDARSLDGSSHSVQVYCDVTGEWLSSDTRRLIEWETSEDSQIIFHAATQQPGQASRETGPVNVAEDATLYFATTSSANVTWQTGGAAPAVRNQFLTNGTLLNTKDANFRAIGDNFPVFALSYDLGNVTSTSISHTTFWALGLIRDPNIHWNTFHGSANWRPYFLSRYNSVEATLSVFLSDFPRAKQRSTDLDNTILSAAQEISPQYADLVSLASRQVSGGVETSYVDKTIGMFMKDIGKSQRISPVETIYASFPAFLYINATWGQYLLEPLLQYSKASNRGNYAVSDLGNAYPEVDNIQVNALRQIEGMAKFTGDTYLLSTYYDVLKQWAETLIQRSLTPHLSFSDSEQASVNSTNLAVKGILGIHAMADICYALGKDDDAKIYLNTATSYAQKWRDLAWSSDHFSSSYGQSSRWSMVYNLYADKLLGKNVATQEMLSAQGRFYTRLSAQGDRYGLPFDSDTPHTAMSHWTMFTAGALADTAMRDDLVRMVHVKASDRSPRLESGVFPTTYYTNSGSMISGSASPAQGAMFALLALGLESKLSSVSAGTPAGSSAGAIAGGVVGGVFALAVLLAIGWYLWKRKQREERHYFTPFTGLYADDTSKLISSPVSSASTPTTSHSPYSYSKERSSFTPPIRQPLISPINATHDERRRNGVCELRADVQNLRRELENLRQGSRPTGHLHEPPPSYT
ncbi:hypothetical protein VNI00_010381 [Paramarasmius palmivorus]|uniref:DUF1793-domain-containing protein n=1 Tax=Paramarasmius palmivorus TaxID=297713 RepID=A0AAW0CKZ6_9AGAR